MNRFVSAVLCLSVVCSMVFADVRADKPSGPPNVAVHQDGPVHGMWVEDQRAMLAIIAKNDQVPESGQGSIPYVAVYVKDATGKMPKLPHAMNLHDGELHLQIPGDGSGNSRIVPMSRIVPFSHKNVRICVPVGKKKNEFASGTPLSEKPTTCPLSLT